MSNALRSDVLIIGAGTSGLYAALLLAAMGVSVRIIDRKPSPALTSDAAEPLSLLLSPHTLQYLQTHQLVDPLMEKGMRHWRFQTYVNQGQGTSATSAERQSYRVWEKKGSRFNWALSCEAAHLDNVLRDALETHTHIHVEYRHELVNLQDMMVSTGSTAAADAIDHPIVATIKDLTTGLLICHRSRIVIGADGSDSFVRKKLGCSQRAGGKAGAVFYTLKVSADGSFPGLRALSMVSKGSTTAMIVGHRNHLFITLEEHPSWSRFSLLDHYDLLVQAMEIHIKSILDPYDIKFSKIHSCRRWQADDLVADTLSMHGRYFLVGSAAQRISPHDMLSINLAFDQVHNLCWKLHLYLKHYASQHILDTYEAEAHSRVKDYSSVSSAVLSLITSSESADDGDGDQSSVVSTATQRLKRSGSWFVGVAPYPTSIISHSSTVAPNSKLKPYTAQQLASHLVRPRGSRSSTSSSTSDPASSSVSIPVSTLSRSRSLNGLNAKHRSFPVLDVVTSENGNSWLFRKPIFRTKTKVKARGYQHYDMGSVVVAPHVDRWRSIKANHFELLDRIATDRHAPSCFTMLVFCTSINDAQYSLQQLKQYLDLPSSIMQYDTRPTHHPQERHPVTRPLSSSSSTESTMSRSSSSITSAGSRLSRLFSSWSSTTSTSSYSTASAPFSASVSPASAPRTAPSSSLFSFIFVTSSTRQQVSDFLAENPSCTLRNMFPYGLDRLYLDHDNQAHSAYDIQEPTLLIVRPDDYIGARIRIPCQLAGLGRYFDRFMVPPVDMDSAAADVAADFCL